MRDLLDIMGARSWRLGESGSGWSDENNHGTMKMRLLLSSRLKTSKPISHDSHEDQQEPGSQGARARRSITASGASGPYQAIVEHRWS